MSRSALHAPLYEMYVWVYEMSGGLIASTTLSQFCQGKLHTKDVEAADEAGDYFFFLQLPLYNSIFTIFAN